MPIPMLNPASMGIVAVIAGALTQFMTMVAGLFTVKLGAIVVFIGAAVALTAALVTSILALLQSINTVLPAEVITFSAAVMPSNLLICISAVISARVARWVYDKNMSTLKRIVG